MLYDNDNIGFEYYFNYILICTTGSGSYVGGQNCPWSYS